MKQNKASITIIKEFEGLSLRVGGWEFPLARVSLRIPVARERCNVLTGEYFERGSISE